MSEINIKKDQLTFLANSIELNALSVEEVIEWCDKQILSQDSPEYWLIELSTAKKHPIDIIKILVSSGAKLNVNDDLFMAILSGAYFNKRIKAERAIQRTRIDCESEANHDLIRRLNKPGDVDSI